MLLNEDCLITLKNLPDNHIDLTITSPPYDNLRDYKGYSFDFPAIAEQLFRTTKEGGVVVWVVGDAVVNGGETGSSFRQALGFIEAGFRLHDTMIYQKPSSRFPDRYRYNQVFEFMFVLSKGKPKVVNLIRDKKNTYAGFTNWKHGGHRTKSGEMKILPKAKPYAEYGVRNNIWLINNSYGFGTKDKIAYKHPATFPEKLVEGHILTWSNENDLVYDPFMGSGTTAKVAIQLNRNWLGSEISKDYCDIIKDRIK